MAKIKLQYLTEHGRAGISLSIVSLSPHHSFLLKNVPEIFYKYKYCLLECGFEKKIRKQVLDKSSFYRLFVWVFTVYV
jgi:hypothetical protein